LDLSVCGSEPGLDLERRSAAGRQSPLGRHSAAGYEDRPHVPGLSGRDQDAALELSHAIEALEFAANPLQSCDPIA
jgi:hypothetical protein